MRLEDSCSRNKHDTGSAVFSLQNISRLPYTFSDRVRDVRRLCDWCPVVSASAGRAKIISV